MGRRNLKEGVENYVDRTEKPRRRDGERCGWGRETLKKGWRTMWMERRNLEEGVENDVDGTEKPRRRGGERCGSDGENIIFLL